MRKSQDVTGNRQTTAKARRAHLLVTLRTQVEMAITLFESNKQKDVDATLRRAMPVLIELLKANKINRVQRQAMADLIEACAYSSEPVSTELSGPMLYVNGGIDLNDLAKSAVWGEAVRLVQ